MKKMTDLEWNKFKDDLEATVTSMTDEDWDAYFNPPPPNYDHCEICIKNGVEFCGTCHCGAQGHMHSILAFSTIYCTPCYKRALAQFEEEQSPYYNPYYEIDEHLLHES